MANTRSWLRLLGMVLVLLAPAGAETVQFTAGAPRTGALNYRFELKPGEVGRGQVQVENRSAQELDFRLYPGQAQGGPNGVLDGPLFGQPVEGAGRWLAIEKAAVRLRPDERGVVNFEVSVPEGTEPGDHLAFVFVELAPESLDLLEAQRRAELDLPDSPVEDRADLHVKVSTRFALAVVVRVPGERSVQLEVTAVEKFVHQGRLGLRLRLRNAGNVYLKPQGQWVLKGPDGAVVTRQDMASWGVVLPGAEIVREAVLRTERPLVRGLYSLEIQVDYADSASPGGSRTGSRAARGPGSTPETKTLEQSVELTLP